MPEARRVAAGGVLLIPAALVLYFAFSSGGVYPGPPAYVAVLLCVILALHAVFAARPFAGLSRWLALAGGALALYSLLALVSGTWSHAPGVARVEFDLPLVYLLAMLVCASMGRTRARLKWMLRGLAAAIVVVCTSGLVTRLLPHVWPTSPDMAYNRLSFPVTYWNALGLAAAIGIVLCVHLSSDLREPPLSRILAGAATPLLAATLFFTFSRGGIAACVIGLLVYGLLGRPRGMLSTLIAVGPLTALAIKVSYDADLLATPNPTTPAAVAQGRHVAIVLLGCLLGGTILRAGLVLTLDRTLRRFRPSEPVRRRAARAGWTMIAATAIVLVVALHGAIANDYHRFFSRAPAGTPTDLRSRLTDPANDGRIDVWTVAWRDFRSAPAVGHGAGSFANTWAQHRINSQFVRDTHSLYLETLDELGVVGLALLLTAILAVLVRVASRIRGSGRSLYAAVFAVLVAWALHSAIDWDWEMPVVTVVFFALGGMVLGRRIDGRRGELTDGSVESRASVRPYPPWRVGQRMVFRGSVAVALVLLAVLPASVWLSQVKLDKARYMFAQGDCVGARAAAESAISAVGNRAEPYEILGYCDERLGRSRAALAAIDKAVSLDPKNWNYAYSLVLLRAAAGLDPRNAARRAVALNPRDPLVQSAWQTFHAGRHAQWRAASSALVSSFTGL